ncbi:MAG: twin-arginine translocase subunit TatC [Coriobacteriales bacterium]|jgi:sec-independent protein translocase protein TatC|nr:twin-arginine translocase subunit TatC [Coriobacteriales bacterium]
MAKKENKNKNTEGRMTIWEHLGELRRRLTRIVIALLIAVCVLYFFAPHLIFFLIQPISGWIGSAGGSGEFVASLDEMRQLGILNIPNPLGGFTLMFKVSAFFAVVVTSPLWIWQLMAFFLPALKPNERKWVLPTFFIGLTLFIFGQVFCYLLILNPAFEWMLGQTNLFANILAMADDYVMLILLFEIAFGFAFQLPLVIFYLIIFNIVPYKKLRKNWRIVYIVLLVFCAVITPDASPVTLFLLFVPMAGLYELSLFISRIVLNKRIKTQNAKLAEEATASEASEDAADA